MNPEKIKSVTFESGINTSTWLEEASEFEEADLQQLNLRLSLLVSTQYMLIIG
jgi:phage terminase large subunit